MDFSELHEKKIMKLQPKSFNLVITIQSKREFFDNIYIATDILFIDNLVGFIDMVINNLQGMFWAGRCCLP